MGALAVGDVGDLAVDAVALDEVALVVVVFVSSTV